eukprot:5712-Heterococcus_DN1.PRE.2
MAASSGAVECFFYCKQTICPAAAHIGIHGRNPMFRIGNGVYEMNLHYVQHLPLCTQIACYVQHPQPWLLLALPRACLVKQEPNVSPVLW